jgi:glycerate kinase
MIKDAIERGYKRITLFLGGSATNDAGTGILHELGFRFLDKNNNELYPMGKNLGLIHSILYPDNSNYKLVSFNLLCDVDNPFYGPKGAARVYSPQKGATEKDVEILDAGLKSFADLILKTTGKDVQSISGAGAAGAVPGGLLSFLNSSILSGTDQFIQLTDYENRLSQVDCIITGEGCLDDQSLHGKLVQGVRKLAHKYNKNLYYLVGHCTLKNNDEFPSQNIYAITDYEKDHEKAMKNAEDHLQKMTLDFISNIQKHQK